MQKLYQLSKHYLNIISFTVDTQKDIRILHSILKQFSVESVIDIACGVGRHCIPLAKLHYHVTGIDSSSHQVQQAQLLAKREGIRAQFLLRDANVYVSKSKFDAAICMWSTLGEEPMQYQKVIENVFSMLKKGGVFIIETKTWLTIPKKEEHTKQSSISRNGYHYKIVVHDRFTEHFRIRESKYLINNRPYSDICITYLLKPSEWVSELKQKGFRKCWFRYQDFSKDMIPNRVYITAQK